MASKRPLKTFSYRGGQIVRHGHAASLHGAILSATRRLMRDRIALVEICNHDEYVLATVQHWQVNQLPAIRTLLERRGKAMLARERRSRVVRRGK
jgi:hypothetical protein